MILAFTGRHKRTIAFLFLFLMYSETLLAAYSHVKSLSQREYGFDHVAVRPAWLNSSSLLSWSNTANNKHIDAGKRYQELQMLAAQTAVAFDGGPSQPEMQQFTPVNSSNMVDLFSGDFTYNIPLLDVGGYPINIAYRSGITMDQEASWVGLGWNINPGSISRSMRGLPDDFNGGADTVRKTMSIKENKTVGVSEGKETELFGLPFKVGQSIGVFHNNYKGWGIEKTYNASVTAGDKAAGSLTGELGLSFANNSQEGLTIAPTLSARIGAQENEDRAGFGTVSVGSSYNARSGLGNLQISGGAFQLTKNFPPSKFDRGISFAYPSFMPSINIPYTSRQFSFTLKAGATVQGLTGSVYINGYTASQKVQEGDRTMVLPAYGYLNYQNSTLDSRSLVDFNREKDIPYREKPAVPHIAIPSYTYDVFAITGEGTGGSFRAYRGDIGYVHDHYMHTKDLSDRFSGDIAGGDYFHAGVDLNFNRSYTQTGPWVNDNLLANTVNFRPSKGMFEAAYFRNPGEKTINSQTFYNAIGSDNVVVPELSQDDSYITTTNNLRLYNNKQLVGQIGLNEQNVVKPERDKRSQVISYLTAEEADKVGLNKYIENHTVNVFNIKDTCDKTFDNEEDQGDGTGLNVEYFTNRELLGSPKVTAIEGQIFHDWWINSPAPGISADNYSLRWSGRLKAPVTGTYQFASIQTDDGTRLWINDTLVINDWGGHRRTDVYGQRTLNLVAGREYAIRYEYFEGTGEAFVELKWAYPGQGWQDIPTKYLYNTPLKDSFPIGNHLVKEKRINSFRRANHISEIDVLNQDGRRYVYGIPVYNLYQKEVTFSVDKNNGNTVSGLTSYDSTSDNTPDNTKGRDNYYNAEEMPAYAHNFLLTGIVSPDYVDVTGDGISDDDPGDAIKFNYSKTAGIANPYQWRAPYITDSATYNEGLRTDSRDDKGNYIYGKKELWYLHSIESKNMVATFFLDDAEYRHDGLEINENGIKSQTSKVKKLRKIALYNKAEFLEKGTSATPVKTVYFDYSYELCKGVNGALATEGKLTLKRIWFTYNGNEKMRRNPYVFSYHANNPNYTIKSFDRWGNYKSPLDNPSTDGVISNADYPYAVQDSAKAAFNAAAWTLNEIKLPSGGDIKVDYESDDYAFVQDRRAMQMFKLAGLSATTDVKDISNSLYGSEENLYAFIKVPVPVTSLVELKSRYLDSIQKLYFKLYVDMPGDKWGKGAEYVPCYADIDKSDCGFVNDMIWVKLQPIDGKSPLAKTAAQFLRLNLASKAYPGSEVGDNVDLGDAVRILLSMADNVLNTVLSFEATARLKKWAKHIDLNRSWVRLACPTYKRMGGGIRVKRVTVYDNWNAMTQQKEATYGQEYTYTTTREVDGHNMVISSGVASYEPGIGGEENPFHLPIEYKEQIAALAPVSMGYTEEPLGESFFPAPSVGYSKVKVRSIHTQNKRSANGYEETQFYTAYDFPTHVDWSMIDDDTKKRFKPGLQNFLRIDAKNFLTLSQGFKVELNDMHGKMRSQATYPENAPDHFTTYTEHFYKVEDPKATRQQLSNTVMAIHPDGTIDTADFIGKDAELLMDMREQQTVVNGLNLSPNTDWIGFFPVFIIPALINLKQREETRFRSIATVKVVQRFGILDSVVQIDKGSRVAVKNLLYDSETGDVLLTQTKNEFEDSVFNFTYPAHWAYDGMGMAYKNIGATLGGIFMKDGRITQGLDSGTSVNTFFASGDEILVASKVSINRGANCNPDEHATFPDFTKIWAVDANATNGGTPDIYFVDREGHAFGGNDITLKIIRSGRRNMAGPAGTVTSLHNPIVKKGNEYVLQLNTDAKVLNASVAHYNQLWKVGDKKRNGSITTCANAPYYPSGGISARESFIANQNASESKLAKVGAAYKVRQVVRLVYDTAGRRMNQVMSYDTIYTEQSTTNANAKILSSNITNAGGNSCDTCLKKLFDYLIVSHRLFIKQSDSLRVSSLVQSAIDAGYEINIGDCPFLLSNADGHFYATTQDSVALLYTAKVGDCKVVLKSLSSNPVSFYSLRGSSCFENGSYFDGSNNDEGGYVSSYDTVRTTFSVTKSGTDIMEYPTPDRPYEHYDTTSTKFKASNIFFNDQLGNEAYFISVIKFGGLSFVPGNATFLSGRLRLYAHPDGFSSPQLPNAHAINSQPGRGPIELGIPGADLDQSSEPGSIFRTWSPITDFGKDTLSIMFPFQDLNIDALPYLNRAQLYGDNSGISIVGIGSYTPTPTYATFCTQHYNDPSKHPKLDVVYILPNGNDLQHAATLTIDSCVSCNQAIATDICYSAITDTVVNPYNYGLLGNFKADTVYTYYGARVNAPMDSVDLGDIRKDGIFKEFAPFWQFDNHQLKMHADSTKWVWTTHSTLYNVKGFELENKDPLNRYNAGLYGYNQTLPVAVVQNSRYREAAFEGFEDYFYTSNTCETSCPTGRHFDFTNWLSHISAEEKHSGKYSLKLAQNDTLGIGASIINTLSDMPALRFTMGSDNCVAGNYLKEIRTDSTSLLPSFTPIGGKKILFSAWVKEKQDCKCESYVGNKVIVGVNATSDKTSYELHAQGSIIEGWQRYESVIELPQDATQIVISFIATGTGEVYFDDIRIHPYNANMKSFVYHPVNLRLMAELDENNYATFYEYDDDGTLVRVKKETERGIKTIKETRSALRVDE